MINLKGYQRKYLRSLAHHLKPTVFIGKNQLSDGVHSSIEDAFSNQEIIKIKLFSTKEENQIIEKIITVNKCYIVGSVGKVLIAYKQNEDIELQKIKLPKK